MALLPVALFALAGCGSLTFSGDKLDYRSEAKKTGNTLEVPPDLTQLSRDSRYAPQGGAVSATSYQAAVAAAQPSTAAPTTTAVATQSAGDVRLERVGGQRFLVTSRTPEQLWPQLRTFWSERGFTLSTDSPDVGILETDWAENRANIPQDMIRRTLGRVIDNLYSSGLVDRFRTRVERGPNGTEVYISHRGMEEVVTGPLRDNARWQARPSDPTLEGELLSRLMVFLGGKEEEAKRQVAVTAQPQPAAAQRAQLVGGAAALRLDEPFERAWRRVGLALDRGGFTVEDRDRSSGLYYVRYVETASPVPAQDKGFLSRLFTFGKKDDPSQLLRYRIAVQASGADATTVAVQNAQGQPDSGSVAQRIATQLVDQLK
ncbi:outer membrane protein assembly factor BamC [Aquabacterium sp. J223]|uniref:outer membrane protein assembly factor BamC n=1 Tax=Aquabacterium sp. J223 TaxID=2898431 RepID=UPI0021AD86E9|nr:outer membrane protein assembly factor BamC [Aquabacterium sp. J223]UUX95177.1 outer membrane protein assembly factor BamC [Aquabacterium sp. J223]